MKLRFDFPRASNVGHRVLAWAGCACALALAGCGGGASSPSALPDGFVDELVANVRIPTDLAFAPDGSLFVTSQPGVLHLLRPAGTNRVALDVRRSTCSERERGLVGVALDPRFATNRFVYVYQTFNKYRTCEVRTRRVPVNRLVRYRVDDHGLVIRRTARILLDNIPSFNAIHNAGDIAFGHDGYLYVSIGDGGRDYARRTNKSFTNHAARDRNVLLGKIVRLTPTGQPAPGNPFSGPGTTRCAKAGIADPHLVCREIFALGLRNPFRFAFDPNTPRTRFFINDVGEVTWEEVNLGGEGADYGWNLREGFCPRHGRVHCDRTPPEMSTPIVAYAHRDGCASITGGAFVPDAAWPNRFRRSYLFADFTCGRIFELFFEDGKARVRDFARKLEVPSVTSMAFSRGALYYTTFARGGQVRRIRWVGEPNG